jgi:uncharacterized protein
MPVTPSYPGIYIQEAPSSAHTIVAAPTNIAVFIGYTHPLKTPNAILNHAIEIFGFTDYQSQFGGFVRSGAFANAYSDFGNPNAFGDMAQAVYQFFLNGGSSAYIVSLENSTLSGLLDSMVVLGNGTLSALDSNAEPPSAGIIFSAIEVTDEYYSMTITIRPVPQTSPPGDSLADIIITYGAASGGTASPPSSPPASATASGPGTVVETYRRVSLNPVMADGKTPNPNYIQTRLGTSQSPVSNLVNIEVGSGTVAWPTSTATAMFAIVLPSATEFYNPGDFVAVMQEDTDLDKVPVFNLMVLPGIANNSLTWPSDESGLTILSTAIAFCERKLAFLIMDPPYADSADGTVAPDPGTVPTSGYSPITYGGIKSIPIQAEMNAGTVPISANAALYFPYLLSPDPITGGATNPVTGLASQIPPAATVAGIFAATDNARGVWKAPAGFQTTVTNASGVVTRGKMTDQRQGVLNPLGINCLRSFPNFGTPVVFGARTVATQTDEQWRYVPVRRTALFLEQTLYANLKWVIFEPNAQPLWSAITMSINAFMLGLFKQGAFAGDTPSDAFLVQCNSQTTTQTDVDAGIVNIVVGFAPLEPAEFVIITIAQLAGQAQT